MRVTVSGTSGSGKTTFAGTLAKALGVRHIDLDAINWQPNWTDLNRGDPEEFRRRVAAVAAEDAWVSCGNYSTVRPIILARATHAIWLDYPKWVVMTRVIRRSFHRAWTGQELWPGTGNTETFRRWLDKEHPIRWAWDTWAQVHERYGDWFAGGTYEGRPVYRVASKREAKRLIEQLAAEASSSRFAGAA